MKLLYLGLAFPRGYADIFPEAQPAGHLIETSLVESIRPRMDIRSTGISWLRLDRAQKTGKAPGLPHALQLLECKPELWHRLRSLGRLKRQYLEWKRSGWVPDLIMACNFSPVYNAFVRWLRNEKDRPGLVLYLADSVQLQRAIPLARRIRYALKPLRYLDSDMALCYDACVAVSKTTEGIFTRRGVPWLWLPNGCDPARALRSGGAPPAGRVRFGYFGTLAPHSGAPALVRVFKQVTAEAELHLWGWGHKHRILAECASDVRITFHGSKSPDECVRFSRDCDVMVNPRPIVPGNENNFSSKVFEYALGGRAILTSRVSGVDEILGPDAFYFHAEAFDASLARELMGIAQMDKAGLHSRGSAVQERMLREFSWDKQGRKLNEFLRAVCHRARSPGSAGPR